ncbi:Phospho-N-acetylmuramoyl-pentapeptide-transferase [Ferrithrix thermotolerans DSM 19514]|uniref:Phospho-N-acetylmuramoyl-pentapeptide-transferase n=2 Tax=Ferrithrix TaxID=643949 RepID=A0A1M4TS11_9ACTN|nr:phospho-N-acetylmuramoyl-pentapeptide-transferase [Ferrithrix thermotolerans]SHE47289.1 Phospho-N-acetylmuramoyl-pentapeptide-transferase [Ferrithrix thermotolerans DSM 19514]
MISILVAGAVSLLVSSFVMPYLIDRFTQRGVGQQIREDGPKDHMVKAGTPTMGGIAIILGMVLGYLAAHGNLGEGFTRDGLLLVSLAILTGFTGFLDDFIKIRNRRSLGLTKAGKFSMQFLIALAFAIAAHYWAHVPTEITFDRESSFNIQLGTVGWIVFATLVVVGASNAVNLTDGLDGLAAGSSIFSFATFAILGYWQFRHFPIYKVPHTLDEAIVSVSMVGALAGFLWWNAPPAKIFMGDTGSLAIGATLGGLALVMQLDLLLVILAGLFVIETLSVIAQVFSFRVFHKRVLRMAPIHHHFELLGWPETTVLIRLWILAALFTALGLGVFYADFLSLGTTTLR